MGLRGDGPPRQRAIGRDGGAGHGVGCSPHVQLRPKGRLPRRRGLPLGGAAIVDATVAVPAVQSLLHRALSERPLGAYHPAGLDGLSTPIDLVRTDRCPAHGALPSLHHRRDRRRPTTVELSPMEERRSRRRSNPEPPIPSERALSIFAAPELLLRTGPVVGGLPLRRGGGAFRAGVDRDRSAAADVALRRLDAVHREDHRSRTTPSTNSTNARPRPSCRGSHTASPSCRGPRPSSRRQRFSHQKSVTPWSAMLYRDVVGCLRTLRA